MISQIMFIKDKDGLKSDVKLKITKAREILGLLRSGSDFSDLAKKYSEDISGPLGGRIGVVERGTTLPRFEEIAFNLKLNEVSDVFQTENGVHIIRCDEVISGHFKKYIEVKSEIKRLLDFEKQDENYTDWMKELRKSAFIEVKLFKEPSKRESIKKSNIKNVEAKLRYLKKLRDNKKISNQKYLEKKKEVLRKF
jgi:parvulin-like peptidyl-prolyl isomerase